jgi:hypothetical protein
VIRNGKAESVNCGLLVVGGRRFKIWRRRAGRISYCYLRFKPLFGPSPGQHRSS